MKWRGQQFLVDRPKGKIQIVTITGERPTYAWSGKKKEKKIVKYWERKPLCQEWPILIKGFIVLSRIIDLFYTLIQFTE